jgi:hypothetical protein
MRISSLLPVMLLATAAHGAMFQVVPGPGTPLQDAVNAASAGDKLVLGSGSYFETVVVDKRLKIVANGPVVIGPEQGALQSSCTPAFVLDIAADGVRIQGGKGVNNDMMIQGGSTAAIRIQGRSAVKLKKVGSFTFCPGAEALHVEAASRVKISGGVFTNFSVSLAQHAPACRLAHLTGRVDLRYAGCRAAINPAGGSSTPAAGAALVIEDVPASLGPVAVNVRHGGFITSGGVDPAVILTAASGVRMVQASLLGAPLILGEPPYYAITFDGASSGNVVERSMLRGPVLDQGSGNCLQSNTDEDGAPLPDACS